MGAASDSHQAGLAAARSAAASAATTLGQLSPFRLRREVGRGGGGVVYEAEDTWLQRIVAVKVFPPSVGETAEAFSRFLMSPEQCRGERVEPASDVYSLGATYFALLTGRAPFEAENPIQVMLAHCSRPVPDPRPWQPDIPEGCVAVLRQAMAKEPTARFASADAMARTHLAARERAGASPRFCSGVARRRARRLRREEPGASAHPLTDRSM